MASERKYLSDNEDILCNYKKFKILESNFSSSTSNNYIDSDSISKRLKNLPKVKARPGFTQRMAAAFAMELEIETQERNKAWLKKRAQISLPDITSDLIKDLF